jgi:hypothetical protein
MTSTTIGGPRRGALFLALLAALIFGDSIRSQERDDKPPARVGQIFIVGNTNTRMNIILEQLHVYPGQILVLEDLKKAEAALVRLDRFVVAPDGSVRPTVTVVDNPNDPTSEYKDILVTVEETPSRSFYHVFYDFVDEWGYLIDIRSRGLVALFVLGPLVSRLLPMTPW